MRVNAVVAFSTRGSQIYKAKRPPRVLRVDWVASKHVLVDSVLLSLRGYAFVLFPCLAADNLAKRIC